MSTLSGDLVRRSIGAALALVCVSGCTPPGSDPSANPADPAHAVADDAAEEPPRPDGRPPISESRSVDVPDSGVELGWGWDSYNDRPVPSYCVEFLISEEKGQVKTVSVHEVSDSYEVMNRLNVSASASVKAMGFSGSAKTDYAKEVKVNGFSSTFIIDATVENGVEFVAPAAAEPRQRDAVAESLADGKPYPYPSGSVRLTSDARRTAGNADAFRRQCGDSFVSAIHSGATLYAAITFNTSSQSTQESLAVEMSGGGWGVEVSGGASSASNETISKTNKDVVVYQTGGKGDEIAIDMAGLRDKLKELPELAAQQPKLNRMVVTPYSQLADWPGGAGGPDIDEYVQLASYWGSYTTLYDEIQAMLEAPADFLIGAVHSYDSLLELQDHVQSGIERMEGFAIACTGTVRQEADHGCHFPEAGFDDPYLLRIQLPLPKKAYPSTELGSHGELAQIAALDIPELADWSLSTSVASLTTKLTSPPPTADGTDTPILTGPDEFVFRTLVADYYVRDPAQRRCDISRTAEGCLSNREVAAWRSCVPTSAVEIERLRTDDVRRAINTAARTGTPQNDTGCAWFDYTG